MGTIFTKWPSCRPPAICAPRAHLDFTNASEAERTERRTQLKELGLSNTFYFIHAGTLLILNAVSGGLFVLYWLFRQWKAVLTGFRRLFRATAFRAGLLCGHWAGRLAFDSKANRPAQCPHKSPAPESGCPRQGAAENPSERLSIPRGKAE